jgi:hypothetical protein
MEKLTKVLEVIRAINKYFTSSKALVEFSYEETEEF